MSLYKTRRAFLSFIKKQPKEDQPEWRRLLDSVLFREDLERFAKDHQYL